MALPVGDPNNSEKDSIEVWQVQPVEFLARFTHPAQYNNSHRPRLNGLERAGNDLMLAQWEGAVSLIDTKAVKEVAAFATDGSSSLSPKGRFFAYFQESNAVGLHDLKTGKSRTLRTEGLFDTGPVGVWSSDERWFATGGVSGKGHLWETATGRLVRSFVHQAPTEDDVGKFIPLTFTPNDTEILFQKNDEWATRFDVQSGKEQSPLHFEEGTGGALDVLSRRDKSKLLYSNGTCTAFELLEKGIVAHPPCSVSGYLLAMSDDGEWMLRVAAEATAPEIQFLSTRSKQVKWRALLIEPRPDSEGIIDLEHHLAAFAGGPVIDIENGHELLPSSEKDHPDYYVVFGKDVAFFPHGMNFLPGGLALSFASASLYGTESIENIQAPQQEARTAGVHWRLSGSTLTAQAEGSAFTWSRDRVTGFQPFEKLGILVMAKPEGLEVIHLRTLKTLFTVRLFGAHQSAFVKAPDGRFEILGSRKAIASDLRCRVHTRVLPLSACVERHEWPGLLRELLPARPGRG